MENFGSFIGKPINVAEFGEVRWWYEEKPEIEVEWKEPRRVYSVEIEYEDSPPNPDKIEIQYWQCNWPTPAPERRKGAGRGWIGVDDPFHGKWVIANTDVKTSDKQHLFIFDPLDITELPNINQLEEAEDFNAFFRQTLKLKVLFKDEPKPSIKDISIYSDSRWREIKANIWFGRKDNVWSGSVKIWNGKLINIEPLNFGTNDEIINSESWRCSNESGKRKGIVTSLLYAECKESSPDRTIATVYSGSKSFSFSINDLLTNDSIYLKDYDVFITREDIDVIEIGDYIERISSQKEKLSIYDRVFEAPEQTFERAFKEIPPLQKTKQHPPYGRYVVLGCENNRKKFALRFNGDIFMNKQLLKLRGRDTSRLFWPGVELMYKFATGDPPDFREREDGSSQSLLNGYLPVVTSHWLDREIEYKEVAFATFLEGDIEESLSKRGDETTVCVVRFSMRNTTSGRKEASLWIVSEPPEELALENGFILAKGRIVLAETVKSQWKVQDYGNSYIRGYLKLPSESRLLTTPYPVKIQREDGSYSITTAVLYKTTLDSYEEKTIDLYIPFDTLLGEEEKKNLSSFDYEEALQKVVDYWKAFIESGGKVTTPNQLINDFFKAVPIHIAINANKDPYSDNITLPAGTLSYGPCGNEACMQIRQLDYRGYHERAEKYLSIFLNTQGSRLLDGDFKTKEGALQGLEVYKREVLDMGFKYNLDHGFILTTLAEHYLLTRDRLWLERTLPNLIEACNFIIRERKNTMKLDSKGEKVPEYGLLPPGHLEDNPEWRHWFAVNAHAWRGMKLVADILEEVHHSESERIRKEVMAYQKDIIRAVDKSMIESPVVKLLDDSFIPHIPTRTGIRGREIGWFREGAYGPLHLSICDVIDVGDEKTTWILKDLEDNIFVTREYGRPVDLEKYWFSHGGIAIQANLLDNAIVYLKRDEIKHAVRSFYNNFASSLYPDVKVFTEHPVVELGHGVGPFYKTPDESGFLNWLRQFLIREDDKRLLLAMGTPREWLKEGNTVLVEDMATYFGPVSYRIESKVKSMKTIEAIITPPHNLPEEIILRIRHPQEEKIKRVLVNNREYSNYNLSKECICLEKISEECNIVVEY